jgi:hypothetical protein
MFVVLRVSHPVEDVGQANEPGRTADPSDVDSAKKRGCVAEVIGVFANKSDAEKCRRTDISKATEKRRRGVTPKEEIACTVERAWPHCKPLTMTWRICPVPHPSSRREPFQSGDTVHVLTHEVTVIDCAGTQEDIDAAAQQFVLHTQITTRDKLKWHTLRFNLYKPGVLADTCMHVHEKNSDPDVTNTLKF